jgi:hypothetical protein
MQNTKQQKTGGGNAPRDFQGNGMRYDYENQAWIQDGRYIRCGHPAAMNCGCYGKLHEGEKAQPAAASEGNAPRYEIKRMLEPQGTTFGIYKNGKLFEYGFLTEKAAQDWLSIRTGERNAPREHWAVNRAKLSRKSPAICANCGNTFLAHTGTNRDCPEGTSKEVR